jgi:hypothetical protein
MIGIYKITSPKGAVYIGQSWQIEKRFNKYKKSFYNIKSQRFLYNSFLKYGTDNHTFKVIHELPIDVDQAVLDTYEILYIAQYKECGFEMLNLREGGHAGGKICEESKKLMRERKLGKTLTKEHKEKIGKNQGIKLNRRAVFQYDLQGNFIKEWDSLGSAAREVHVFEQNIRRSCKNNKRTGQFKWKYKNN